jgi:hypothetical protein
LVLAIDGTMSPSDSLSARLPFAIGLWESPSPDVGRRGGSLQFRVGLSLRALSLTPGASWIPPASSSPLTSAQACPVVGAPFSDPVCCLRRDMIGSAAPPFGFYLTRLQSSRFRIGPAALLPSHASYDALRALDTPLKRRDLSPRPGSATRRTGAYRGGTFTRKSDTA